MSRPPVLLDARPVLRPIEPQLAHARPERVRVDAEQGWAATSRLATLDAQRVEQDATGTIVYVHVLTRRL